MLGCCSTYHEHVRTVTLPFTTSFATTLGGSEGTSVAVCWPSAGVTTKLAAFIEVTFTCAANTAMAAISLGRTAFTAAPLTGGMVDVSGVQMVAMATPTTVLTVNNAPLGETRAATPVVYVNICSCFTWDAIDVINADGIVKLAYVDLGT